MANNIWQSENPSNGNTIVTTIIDDDTVVPSSGAVVDYVAEMGGDDMSLAGIQSVTGLKTFDKEKIAMKGTSTGKNTISVENTSATSYLNTMPAKSGTFAMTDDITGINSGTNTGDETTETIKTKLGNADTDSDGYLTSSDWNTFNSKQSTLVSGTNIKTINSTSLLGNTNIAINHSTITDRDIAGNHSKIIPNTDSTNAFSIYKADGTTPALTIDTINNQAVVNGYIQADNLKGINAKATSQALITTAAISGSTGIQIINDSNINFGTGDFSINIVLAVPDWTPAANVILAQKHDTTNGWILTLLTTGKLRLTINSTTYDSTTAITATNGFTANIVASVKRSSTYRDGYVKFFQDGKQLGESVAIAQGALVTVDNTSIAYIAGTSAITESVILSFFCTFNKTISETEAYNFYINGLLPENKNGTMSAGVWGQAAGQFGSETHIYSLCVLNGEIYGGTYPNGKLLKWNGSNAWVEVAPKFGSEIYIFSLCELNGEIYGGTAPNGKLLKWNSSNAWTEVAPMFGSETHIYSLCVLNGEIYGGTAPNGKLLKWNGSNAWVEVAPKFGSETIIYALVELNGEIYGGTYPNGKLLKWNGSNAWVEVAPRFGSEYGILSLIELNGEIYGGTAPNSKLLKWNGSNAWLEVAPKFGSETHIYSLCVLNGEIYGGTAPNGKLLKWNGSNAWLEVAPKFGSETIIYSLIEFNGEIYGGTYPNGKLLCSGMGATAVLEPDKLQTKQWIDSSINKLHAMLPAAGTDLKLSKNSFEIRWVNTWAGTHEAQYIGGFNQAILPVGCYIESIIGVISGTTIEDIIVGDGSDTDRWVAATTGLAAGTVSFTIANRISDGTNYKMVVDPDGNFTGSISWIIKGIIL